MKILFINNDGAGFANHIEIEADTTVQSLFNQRIGEGRESNYLIRVNRQPVSAEQFRSFRAWSTFRSQGTCF